MKRSRRPGSHRLEVPSLRDRRVRLRRLAEDGALEGVPVEVLGEGQGEAAKVVAVEDALEGVVAGVGRRDASRRALPPTRKTNMIRVMISKKKRKIIMKKRSLARIRTLSQLTMKVMATRPSLFDEQEELSSSWGGIWTR